MDKPTFTIRNEVDFIALAPIVLGFQPQHSLVMMTANSFHARVDLPSEADIDECLDALVSPAIRHQVSGVAFLIYDDGEHGKLKAEVVDRFRAADITVLCALEVGDGKYRQFWGEWQPLDLSDHPLVLEAQFHDIAPAHQDRHQMVESIRPVGEDASPDITEALENLKVYGLEGSVVPLSRELAKEQAKFWTKVVRSCEPDSEQAADASIVLAWAAWLAGDGAKAWAALDQGNRESNWHRMLCEALEQAVDPAMWDGFKNGL